MLKTESTYVARPALEHAIRSAVLGRKRLLLAGRVGSGRKTVLCHTLIAAGFSPQIVDLAGVLQMSDVTPAFRNALAVVARAAKPHRIAPALLVCNLDGCRGLADEGEIVGAVRARLQLVQSPAVFYTAADPDFIDRHCANPRGSFFKQCTILPVGALEPVAVDEIVLALTGTSLDALVRAVIVDAVGLYASDLKVLITRQVAARAGREPLTIPGVQAVLRHLVQERRSQYAAWLHGLSGHQRAVLTAFARGTPLRATQDMALASGVPVRSLVSTIMALQRNGCLTKEGDRSLFRDPFLRLHLLAL